MHVITFKGRPATVRELHEAEGKQPSYKILETELESYLATSSESKAKKLFLSWFGFTWAERAKGIDVAKVVL